jgi:hypothetical protein
MSEMVDRVAYIFYAAEWNTDLVPFSGECKDYSVKIARDAIEVLLYPTTELARVMSEHARNGMVDWRDIVEAYLEEVLK